MPLPDLATIEDYKARFGLPEDLDRVEQLLTDASDAARRYAGGQQISLVADDVAILDGDDSDLLVLPQRPVVAVTAVSVNGAVLSPTTYRWRPWGTLERRDGWRWGRDDDIAVTYDHGIEETPAWIVGIICAAVRRGLLPGGADGVSAEELGDHKISYTSGVSTADQVSARFTDSEIAQLGALRGTVIA